MDALVDPTFLLFVLGVGAGGFALWRRWWGAAAFLFLFLSAFYFLASAPGAALLLRPLETRYPPLLSPPGVSAIVVLSAGEAYAEDRPIPSGLSSSSLDRVVEAVRLFWTLDGQAELWFVGGEGFLGPGIPLTAQTARALGVPKEKIRWITGSKNTWEDAAAVAAALAERQFILVTSAFHMPRAVWAFHRHGLLPIPAPCGHRTPLLRTFRSFLPQTQALSGSALAMREHFGLFWYRLRYR